MRSISESFKLIISKQKDLGYHMPKILNPPADSLEIIETEKKLNIIFNNELKELYNLANGIYNDYETPSGLTGLLPIHNFISLNEAIDYYDNSIEIEDYFTNWDGLKPENKLFPFLEDGAGNCYWVDLNSNSKNENRIFWTNTFGESPDYLYQSLTNFFDTIAESYDKNLFSLDEDGYLEMDYNKFEELSTKNNSELEYCKK